MKQLQETDYALKVHRKSVQKTLPEMAKFLDEVLTRPLLMYIVDVKDPKTIARWIKGEVSAIRSLEVEKRLRAADQMVEYLLLVEDARSIPGWFLGMNPTLDDESPAEVLHDGRLSDALGAASSYVAFAW